MITFELKFDPAEEGGPPPNMALLGELLGTWSNLIETVHYRDEAPAIDVHKTVVTEILRGSLRLMVTSPDDRLAALKLVNECVRTNRLDALPSEAWESMHDFGKILQRSGQILRFVRNDALFLEEASMRAAPEPAPQSLIKGRTVIVGKLRTVGGAEPKITLETRGKTIRISISREEAPRIAPKIYEVIVADVDASWDVATAKIVRCSLLKWRPGPNLSIAAGARAMADHHGAAWAGIDPVSWLRAQRDDDA